MNTRAFFKVVRNSFISELEYRSNYAILIFSTLITMVTEVAVFKQIYGNRESLEGFPRAAVLPFVLLSALVRYAYSLWTLVSESVDEIRDGTFRKYLLQPLHYPTYFRAKIIGPKLTTWILGALTLIITRHFSAFAALLPAGTWLAFAVALVLACSVAWEIYLFFVSLGFWIEEATFIGIAFNIGVGLFSGTLLPLAWLPSGLRAVLAWTPFPIMGDFPVRAGLNLLTGAEFQNYFWSAILWLGALITLNIYTRRAGIRSYEAYGG
ncbi:MAG: ABC-2 family transporter protein [Bdellovibrionales bacterium]|nr:ABC-2 family transporter protein [Bdellovibrionales bacterium]